MLGRKKDQTPEVVTQAQDAPASTISSDDVAAGGKGRPTPKRREAEAKNRLPLVVNDPKAARAAQRKANAEARARMNEAMVTGEDKYLPAQHRGEQRRYIRDYVDARWSLGEFFLPIAFVFVILTFVLGNDPRFALPLLLGLYALVAVAVVDAIFVGRRIRKQLAAKFGAEKVQKGTIMYAVLRSFQLRPTRMPKPQNRRGQYPA
ncbi:DUF3043 domain-containing protein [Salana multivorans]